ncbi:hypothetical protein M569_04999, partial [Genlisea aurea]
QLSNGYLDSVIDWVPGINGGVPLKDFPFINTVDPDDILLNFVIDEVESIPGAKGLILNTFADLERQVLDALLEMMPPPIYTVGPLNLYRLPDDSPVRGIESSLWKEENDCVEWLDGRATGSVVYVNFGSNATVTAEQLAEFAWGLAGSGCPFLWAIRPDIVFGDSPSLPPEFLLAVEDVGMLTSWAPQEKVLGHRAVGVFLTHSGWNSTLESITNGVPVICWPFFAEQRLNCRFSCGEWGIGVEIGDDVRRGEVEAAVREAMGGGQKGKSMAEKATEWRNAAVAAVSPDGGDSYADFNRMI